MRKRADSQNRPSSRDTGPQPSGAHGPVPPTAGGHSRRRSRPILILVNFLIIVLFVTGAYLIFEPYYLHWRQDRKTAELLQSIEKGDGTIVMNANELKVPGEEDEFTDDVENWDPLPDPVTPAPTGPAASAIATGATEPTDPTEEPYDPDSTADDPSEPAGSAQPSGSKAAVTPKPTQPQVVINAIGQMIIDKISLKMPIADRAETAQLRVALGLLGGSSMPGKPGNSIILGHRMYTYGRHFNRLDEVVAGTKVVILTKGGRKLTYVVDHQDIVLPTEMRRALSIVTTEKQLILVTCTPIRVASHRLLVYCKLISDEPA